MVDRRFWALFLAFVCTFAGLRVFVQWNMFPRYGFISSLDLTADGAQGIILAEIFQAVPGGISVQEAALRKGKDTALYVKCTVPEGQMTNDWLTQHWHVRGNPAGRLFHECEYRGIKWLPSDTNDMDCVYARDSGLARMQVMKPASPDRVLYIFSYGLTNEMKLSGAFWRFANIHSKPVRSWEDLLPW
ncbi:MAG: hypothetical protein FWG50_04350 [Kiritimatiellaeota bacterium]|nr:hypothetical protein [Kiritimatiellota bacterium]